MAEKTLVFFGEFGAQLFRCSDGNGSVLLITGTQKFIRKVFEYCSNCRLIRFVRYLLQKIEILAGLIYCSERMLRLSWITFYQEDRGILLIGKWCSWPQEAWCV